MKFTTARPTLSKIDLNLLVVLDVLLREQSVGKTAARLNLTSSAVSHALKRLRLMFDNELLIRDGHRMVPTARGQSLSETLPSLLAQIELTLIEPEPFDPATSTRSFRLAAPDFISPLLPHLLTVIENEAPGVSVELAAFVPTADLNFGHGRVDAIIAPTFRRKDDLRGSVIGSWSWRVYGRQGHPAFENWSLDSWASFSHLQVNASSPSGRNPIDFAAGELGVTRAIGAVVPQFSMAAPILAKTDMLLTVPSVTMTDTALAYKLGDREIPFELAPLELSVFTSAQRADQPENRWFLDCVLKAAKELKPSQ